MRSINRIGVFTSGGDAPGMNAAIRAIIRKASVYDLHVYSIQRGYEGMIDGDIGRLEDDDVRNIIHHGGTFIRSARSKRFLEPEHRKIAFENLKAFDIDALVAIGGNGTFTGSLVFSQEFDMPTIGLPGTIDNDLYGTDFTIGFDTAVNTAVEAVDKIRDTADSHNRLFIIEVMGRNSGYIALHTAIASGASAFVIPEEPCTLEELAENVKKALRRKKLFGLIISAEGNHLGNGYVIQEGLKQYFPEQDIRVTVIGHLQRGGAPTAADRILAARLGYAAVEGLMEGKRNVMAGIMHDKVVYTPFDECINREKKPGADRIELARILGM